MSTSVGPSIETASWGRRFVALLVDWLVSTLVVVLIVGPDKYTEPGSSAGFLVVAVYVVESTVFTWLLAGSFGKIATGLRVVPADGRMRPISPLRLLVRQALVALVVPALVFRPDGRGLHDLVADTSTVSKATFLALIDHRA